MIYLVTTVTHPAGDYREFRNASDAYAYASEIVGEGFEPVIFKGDKYFNWEAFHAFMQGWNE